MYQPYTHDTERYVDYYMAQAGGDLAGYSGLSSQYGAGIGGIFRGLFRTIFPLMKKGFAIAKPHLKTAGKAILSEVVSRAVNSVGKADNQEGSGMIALRRRGIKRPPGEKVRSASAKRKRRRVLKHKKRRSKCVKRRAPKKRKSTLRREDRSIF